MSFGNFCKRFAAAVGGVVMTGVTVFCAAATALSLVPTVATAGLGYGLTHLLGMATIAAGAAASKCFHYAGTGKWPDAKTEATETPSSGYVQRA